jgi:hypothetical protein
MKQFRTYLLGSQLLLMVCLVVLGTTPWFYNSEFNRIYFCKGQPECYPGLLALMIACVMLIPILFTWFFLWRKSKIGGK